MRMKARNSYLILFVLIVVFAAGFFLMSSVFSPGVVFSLRNGEEISSIKLSNAYGTFFFLKDKDSEIWSVEAEGIWYRTHVPKMTLLLSALSDMPVRRVLESENDNYYLNNPAAIVVLETNNGKRYEYSFGRTGADVNSVYVKNLAGVIVLTDSFVFDQVMGSLAAYRDKKVFSVDLFEIERLEYFYNGQVVVNCYRESPTEWYMDFPWSAPARHIELTELVARMSNWIIAGYPDVVDLKESRLDPPLETLVLTDNNGKRQTLDFGTIDGLSRYVRTGDRGDVVYLYAADVDLSILSPDSLFFIAPLRSRLELVSGFSVKYGNEGWDLFYDQLSNTAFWDNGILSGEEFVSVFYRFISMVADGRDSGTVPRLTGSPAASLMLNHIEGLPAKLDLFPRDDNGYFMRINGEDTPYYINAKRLSDLLDRIFYLADGKLNTMPQGGGTGGKA